MYPYRFFLQKRSEPSIHFVVPGHQLFGLRADLRTSALGSTGSGDHHGLTCHLVHAVDDDPGLAVGKSHTFGRLVYGASLIDLPEKFIWAGTEIFHTLVLDPNGALDNVLVTVVILRDHAAHAY